MNEWLAIGGLVSLLANVVLYLLWREAEARWDRKNEEPRVLYMPEPALDMATQPEPLPRVETPTIEERITASFPPDPVTAGVPLLIATDSTATRPVEPAVIPIKRKPKKRRAKK